MLSFHDGDFRFMKYENLQFPIDLKCKSGMKFI